MTKKLKKVVFILCVVCVAQATNAQWICPDSANQASWLANQVRVYMDTTVSCDSGRGCGTNERFAKITIEVPPDTSCRCKISWVEINDKVQHTQFRVCSAKPVNSFCEDEDWMLANFHDHIMDSPINYYPASRDSCGIAEAKALFPYYCGCPNLQECSLMNRCANDYHPRKLEIFIAWDRSTDTEYDPLLHLKRHDFYLKIYIDCGNRSVWQEYNCTPSQLFLTVCDNNPTIPAYPGAIRLRF